MPDYKPPDQDRCAFRSRDGRRCTLLRHQDDPELCLHHLRRWLKEHDEQPPRLPVVGAGQLDNPSAVRRSLKHIIREVAEGRIPAPSGRVLVQLGRLLLKRTRRRPPRRGAQRARRRAAGGWGRKSADGKRSGPVRLNRLESPGAIRASFDA